MEYPQTVAVAMEARRLGYFLDARRLAQCISAARAIHAHPNLWRHFLNDINQVFAFIAERKGGNRKRKLDGKDFKIDCRGPCCTGPSASQVINLPVL